jgi:aminomethyltransferase
VIARTGYTGEDGVEIFCPAVSAVALWNTLLERGKDDGLLPCGLGARDTLRIEAALPLYGHELGGDISPYEVRVGWAVNRNRPDMVGFEALERAAKSAPRRLVGLFVEGGIAREGAPVFTSGGSEQVGIVTSGTHSPTLGKAVALALVTKEAAASVKASPEPGAGSGTFEVEVRGKRRAAPVTGLPFCVKRPQLQ